MTLFALVLAVGMIVLGAGTLLLEGEDKPLLPAELEVLSTRRARLTLHEGRYHQIKRMFHRVGNRVMKLHRESIGAIHLPPDLGPGEWRILTAAEITHAMDKPPTAPTHVHGLGFPLPYDCGPFPQS